MKEYHDIRLTCVNEYTPTLDSDIINNVLSIIKKNSCECLSTFHDRRDLINNDTEVLDNIDFLIYGEADDVLKIIADMKKKYRNGNENFGIKAKITFS